MPVEFQRMFTIIYKKLVITRLHLIWEDGFNVFYSDRTLSAAAT